MDDKLDKLLHEWSKVKHQISQLEQREKDIKNFVMDTMIEQKTNSLHTENYKVYRRLQKKSHISKDMMPDELWSKYSKKIEYPVFYLRRI